MPERPITIQPGLPGQYLAADSVAPATEPHERTMPTVGTDLSRTEFGTYAFLASGVSITNPLFSECGRFSMSPADYGFAVWQSGGGCTAWRQEFKLNGQDVYMLITDPDGLSHEIANEALVGVYSEDGEAWAVWLQRAEDPPELLQVQGELPGAAPAER